MNYVIITAGGTGKRMGAEVPKQFLELAGKPILMHTIKRFFDYDKHLQIILSLPENCFGLWEKLCFKHDFKVDYKLVSGGKTRFHSIKNALKEVFGNSFVAVHDGVRPLVSNETIKQSFFIAEKYGNSVASQEIVFSLRKKEKGKTVAVNRDLYFEIQTPQTFKIDILKKAYEQDYTELFTDDASVVEAYGKKIHLTKGNKENIKITNPADLKIAEILLNTVV